MERKLHPLLNPASVHYETEEMPTIYYLEQQLTIREMIGACKFNIAKYDRRAKGQDEEDDRKATDYSNYLMFLEDLLTVPTDSNLDLNYYHVRSVIDTYRKHIVYKS